MYDARPSTFCWRDVGSGCKRSKHYSSLLTALHKSLSSTWQCLANLNSCKNVASQKSFHQSLSHNNQTLHQHCWHFNLSQRRNWHGKFLNWVHNRMIHILVSLLHVQVGAMVKAPHVNNIVNAHLHNRSEWPHGCLTPERGQDDLKVEFEQARECSAYMAVTYCMVCFCSFCRLSAPGFDTHVHVCYSAAPKRYNYLLQ